ncbi:hypothetical protein F5B22DRAFT_278590 [Xylaria bambusicola]|uniref:uncharacterized protein n=1 Tax=Xylaria bambusicola TaxID=326684 RepID=UPI00200856A2|nr:uncharacterized protein F5B22DRAFT_278590 [Xylaria bambusicola]KAI0513201.1 hypothetical protein F5B22DRAFT_278590 [Xylaria bambusicola]
MAPPRHTGGESLPRTFTCRQCGQKKPPAAFSQSQIQKWRNKKRNDRYNTVTPENAELVCKDHAFDQRELRCHGPCDRIKIVDHFSKNQRNNTEPWCIDCTEWKQSFDGNELPTAMPNAPLAAHEYAAFSDDDDSADDSNDGLRIQARQNSSYDDEESSDDSSDEDGNPYDNPTLLTNAIDRLQGYGLANTAERTTTDAASTTDTVINSGRGGVHPNASQSVVGTVNPVRTVNSTQASTMGSQGTVISNPILYGSSRTGPYSQGYPSGQGDTALSRVPPHRRGLVAPNPQGPLTGTHQRPAQAGQLPGWGDCTPSSSTRPLASQSNSKQMSDKDRAAALVNQPPGGWTPAVKKQEPKKENTDKSRKWYKGDNRKVFPGHKKTFGERIQDGTEAAHDSDSPDEM